MSRRAALLWALLPTLVFAQAEKKARVVLRWKPTAGATGYQVQVASDPGFRVLLVDAKASDPVLKWEALPSATWFWRVRSFDSEGRPSEWSASRTIAPATGNVTLRGPPENAQLYCTADGVKLEVEPAGGLKSYTLEVAADGRFLEPRTQESTDGTARFELAPGSWAWRARAVDQTGRLTGYSEPQHFTVNLGAPRLYAVPDLPTGVATVALEWTQVPCAHGYVIDAVHEAGEHTTLHEGSNRLTFKPALAGVYRWRVAALDERGVPGDYSLEGSFSVRTAAPFTRGEAVGAVLPKGREVELRWLPAPSAETYLLEVGAHESFRDAQVKLDVKGTQAKLVLAPGLYWWRVTGRDAKEHLSFPSEPRRLVVPEPPPPELPKLLSPPADALVPRAVNGVLAVAFQLGHDTDHVELELDGKPLGSFKASPVHLPRVPVGDHVLRARAVAPWGTTSAWTQSRTFFFGAPASTAMEVSFQSTPVPCDGETKAHVHLYDDRGRPLLGRLPVLQPTYGRASEPRRKGDGFEFTYFAPPHLPTGAVDPFQVQDLELVQSEEVPLAQGYKPVSLAAWLGLRVNGGAVLSPDVTVEGSWRPSALYGRLETAARLGFYFATARVPLPGGEAVYGDAQLFPLTVLAGYHLELGPWSFRAMGGGGAQLGLWRLGLDSGAGGAPSLEALVSGGRQVGPGRLELELSVLYGRLDVGAVKLNAGVFAVALGYRLGVGKGELAR